MPAIFQIIISSLATTLLCGLVVAPVSGRPSKALQFSETFLSVPPASVHFPEQTDLLENEDCITEDVNINVRRRRQAVKDKSKLWPGGVVPYVLEKTQADNQKIRDRIKAAMRQVEQSVGNKSHPCVQFVPRTTEVNYLDVRWGNWCGTHTGLANTGPQELTLAPECVHRKGNIMHELLHALGLYHEQSRYDRDDFVDINSTNMMENKTHNYELYNKCEIDTFNTTYDFTSIMHYGPYTFAKDPRRPVMTPKKRYSSGVWMGQRHALSHLDVLRIQRLYHCPEDTSHILSDSSMDKRLVWCDFENGTCTFVVSSNSSDQGANNGGNDQGGVSSTGRAGHAQWMVTSEPTPDGPKAGSTNGLDPFFYASRQHDKVSLHMSLQTNSDALSGNSAQTSALSGNSLESSAPYRNSMESSALPDNLAKSSIISDKSTLAAEISEKSADLTDTSTDTTSQLTDATSQATDATSQPKDATSQPADRKTSEPNVTVALKTPIITIDTASICVESEVFQTGPSSYLKVYVMGPFVARKLAFSTRKGYRNAWAPVRATYNIEPGSKVQFEFVLVLGHGSVSLDNIHILKGSCQ